MNLKLKKKGIHATAIIESRKIGKDVYIGAYCYIGKNVSIGDNTTIFGHVHIYDNCIIGNNVIINSSSVIGADGFGYETGDILIEGGMHCNSEFR